MIGSRLYYLYIFFCFLLSFGIGFLFFLNKDSRQITNQKFIKSNNVSNVNSEVIAKLQDNIFAGWQARVKGKVTRISGDFIEIKPEKNVKNENPLKIYYDPTINLNRAVVYSESGIADVDKVSFSDLKIGDNVTGTVDLIGNKDNKWDLKANYFIIN